MKLKNGMVIKVNIPIPFKNGMEFDTFEVADLKRRVFIPIVNGTKLTNARYIISRAAFYNREVEILKEDNLDIPNLVEVMKQGGS